jgi:restriction endonuclease S subunit
MCAERVNVQSEVYQRKIVNKQEEEGISPDVSSIQKYKSEGGYSTTQERGSREGNPIICVTPVAMQHRGPKALRS